MKIFTIGFTKTTAQRFFTRLQDSGAKNLVDVRLNNISQLAGFAKRDDLKYFASALCGVGYQHVAALAPTQDMLDEYKKNGGDWDSYAAKFNDLITKRHIETMVSWPRKSARVGFQVWCMCTALMRRVNGN